MKNHFKQFPAYCLLILIFTSCNNSENNDASEKELALQKKEVELKEKELAIQEKEIKLDSIRNANQQDLNTDIETETVKDENDLSGKHNLTLQWISWQAPGKVTFTPIGKDEYKIEGQQKGTKSNTECSECYLNIQGTIEKISPKVLRFTGFIESSVPYIQNGEPCIKEGTFDFVSTGSRKYWRCQNMDGCDGVTDYVDIYFK